VFRIGITTGDLDGVGLEVTIKALGEIGPQRGFQFFLMRGHSLEKRSASLLERKWNRCVFPDLSTALGSSRETNSLGILFEVINDRLPPIWVEEAALACLDGRLDGLCTAPLSKTLIKLAGLKDLGHTEIFKRLSHCKEVNMGFAGNFFNVVLATDHIPFKKVPSFLTPERLHATLINARSFVDFLPAKIRKRPIALLGLNPHAGECGLLGGEERDLMRALKTYLKKEHIVGPIPPDVAFLKKNWSNFSVYVAAYHDQGLIPFKMAHGQNSGVQISLGLPFVRTSVDHGTAKDIFGMNCANPNSMIFALQWCQKLVKLKKKGAHNA
jgi:4-hydroxythreonine-4-phosphate dehydrogenase